MIVDVIPAARIAVRLQKELVIIYAFGSIEDYENLKAGGYAGDFEKELIERGLIPAPCKHAFQYIDEVPRAVCTICGAMEVINSPSNEQK